MESEELGLTPERQAAVRRVADDMPRPDLLYSLADLFKMLGDPTRVRILCALSLSELCVYDLSLVLQMDRSAVSHQLRLLRAARLVRARREGKMVYYCIDDDHVGKIFEMGIAHIEE